MKKRISIFLVMVLLLGMLPLGTAMATYDANQVGGFTQAVHDPAYYVEQFNYSRANDTVYLVAPDTTPFDLNSVAITSQNAATVTMKKQTAKYAEFTVNSMSSGRGSFVCNYTIGGNQGTYTINLNDTTERLYAMPVFEPSNDFIIYGNNMTGIGRQAGAKALIQPVMRNSNNTVITAPLSSLDQSVATVREYDAAAHIWEITFVTEGNTFLKATVDNHDYYLLIGMGGNIQWPGDAMCFKGVLPPSNQYQISEYRYSGIGYPCGETKMFQFSLNNGTLITNLSQFSYDTAAITLEPVNGIGINSVFALTFHTPGNYTLWSGDAAMNLRANSPSGGGGGGNTPGGPGLVWRFKNPSSGYVGNYQNTAINIPLGNQSRVEFAYYNGQTFTTVPAADLTFSDPSFAVQADSNYPELTIIRTRELVTGSVSYQNSSITIEVGVPGAGYYSNEEISKQTFIGTGANYYCGEAKTVYFRTTPSDLIPFTEATSENSNVTATLTSSKKSVKVSPAVDYSTLYTNIAWKGSDGTRNPSGNTDAVFVATQHLSLEKVEATAATATTAGNIEYYKDSGTGKFYKMPALTVAADAELSRAALAQAVVELFNVKSSNAPINFTDVDNTMPEYDAIMRACNAGLMAGSGAGTFSPETKMTVVQALNILMRATDPRQAAYGQTWEIEVARWAQSVGILKDPNIALTGNAKLSDFDLSVLPIAWTELTQAQTVIPATGGGGYDSGPSGTTPTTNDDGSKTETTTNTDGSKTEVTTNTDGSKTAVTTNTDSSKIETNTAADGSTGEVKTDADGKVTEASAAVSEKAAAEAGDEAVTLQVELPAAENTAEAAPLQIEVPEAAGSVTVEIPVTDVDANSVVVLVHEDGTEEVLPKVAMTDKGLAVEVSGNVTVKIVDNAQSFNDMPADPEQAEAIQFVSSRGMMNGVGNDSFAPEEPMTRGMITTVLYRMERKPDAPETTSFADVPDDEWYSDAVAWAAEAGIVEGYGDEFGVDDSVTNEQIVVMLWRMAGKPEAAAVESGASSWATAAMNWAIGAGLIDRSATGANAGAPATRGQVSAMVMRFINL